MKINFITCICLLMAVFMSTPISAEESYVELEDGIITFYYDSKKTTRNGNVFDIAAEYAGDSNYPAWQSTKIIKAVFDESFSNYAPTSTARWFYGCSQLAKIEGIGNLNTSSITNMGAMFYNCSSLSNIDLSGFNTSNVTNMYCMFFGCKKLETLDLGSFDTENVTIMTAMFYGCSALREINLSSFNTKSVVDMQYLFYDCTQLSSLDILNFNTSNVTNMESMFAKCGSLIILDLRSFDTSNVTNIETMFCDCTSLETIFVCDKWSSNSFREGLWVFDNCPKLVGGNGTTNANLFLTGYRYAKIDEDYSPGYLTYKSYTCINNIFTASSINTFFNSLDGNKHNNRSHKGVNIINGKKIICK